MVVPPKSQDITFDEFLKELPDEYHDMAYEFKAFTRSRKIKTPAQLLQVVMLYCGLDHVLRETVGIFTLQEERITDTAIHKRLKVCEPWLKALLTKLLPSVKNPSAPLRILVVDGSSLQGPGAKGTDYRLHLALDLVSMTLHEVHVTGADQGESLSRYEFASDDVVLVDRGYNHPATILDLNAQGVDVLLRLQPAAMPLYLRQAGSLACGPLPELRLNSADYLRKATSDLVSIPVWLHSKGRSCSGIVHAYRLPPEAAEAARRRCRQDGNRQPEWTNSGAGYFIFGRLGYGIHNGIRRRSGGFDHYQFVSNPLASRAGFHAFEKPVGSGLAALPKLDSRRLLAVALPWPGSAS